MSGNAFSTNEFTIDLIRRIRTIEREISRLSTKDPGSGVITGLTLDHLNLGTASGATTGQLHASSHIQTTDQFISTLATGTPPMVVSSTTKVTNFNADLLDGLDTATSGSNAHVVATDASGDTSLHRMTITQVTGSSPLVVSSTTVVTNFNADLLDGLNAATSGASAHIVATDASGNTSLTQLTLTQTTGTAPMVVSSTTRVTNFNADLLDNLDTSTLGPASAFIPATDSSGNLRLLSLGVNCARDPQFDVDIGGNLRAQGWIVGKHAIQLSDAVLIAHYDGALPYNSDRTGSVTGHRGQVGTIAGGILYTYGKFGKGIAIPEATTNLITNPSFETNTTSWAGFSSATISRVTTDGYYGTCSLKIITAGGNAGGAQYIITTSTQASYTASCWVKAFSSADVGKTFDLYMRFSYTDATTSDATLRITLTTDWQLMAVSATTNGAKTLSTILIFIRDALSQAASISVLADAVQVEAKAYRTPYTDGSLGTGYSWSGTAHASTSSRTAASLTYSAVAISPSGTISVWVRSSALMSANGNNRFLTDAGGSAGIRLFVSTADALTLTVGGVNRVTFTLTDGNFLVDTWHHIVGTWDQATAVSLLYIDGAQVSSTGGYGVPTDDNGGWDVSHAGGGSEWAGEIDDFALTSTLTSASQVRAIYESNAPVFAETSTFTFNTPTQKVYADADGLWVIDSANLAVLGVSSVDSHAWGGLTLDAADVLIGRSTAYLLWDNSAATLSFLNAGLRMSGTDSFIAIGTTPPTSATVGTGIWIDRTGMYGLAANVQQAIFSATTGKITAGAGTVTMDSTGISINGNVLSVYNSSAVLMGTLGGDVGVLTADQVIKLRASGIGATGRGIELDVINGAGTHRAILTLDAATGSALIRFNLDAAASDILQLAPTTVTTTGQIVSTVSGGTAPFAVSSTTKVTNLNSDTLNGLTWAVSGSNQHVMATDPNGDVSLHRMTLTQATGTAPLTVSSTTKVTNFNADLLDGLNTDATGAADAHVVATDSGGAVTLAGDVFSLGFSKGLQAQIQDCTVYTASGALTLTTGFQDVSGLTTGSFTPSVNETAYVEISVSFSFAAGTANAQVGDSLQAQLDLFFSAADHAQTPVASITVDGTAAVGTATTAGIQSVTKHFQLALTSGTAYTIKVQAKNNTGARGQVGTSSQMKVWRIAR